LAQGKTGRGQVGSCEGDFQFKHSSRRSWYENWFSIVCNWGVFRVVLLRLYSLQTGNGCFTNVW